ncbi:unnamed protein product [Photorhabdus laumondii subsp. laumondii TTO1]|uniref:Photorhabdus luminescens subsp. laumondii TTO1 complete genome segment 12/17 n=1 Tax=Photorhabdus laumondii subsp. laumondii (strain DSM 15139 / CIP 105565 / TT01) TaxID=243265 RepID=Q7N214_PHOLL|nr:unnamed protein product [Photorhabdus laumondii subsp. laumondii TTO1]
MNDFVSGFENNLFVALRYLEHQQQKCGATPSYSGQTVASFVGVPSRFLFTMNKGK